MGLKVIPDQTFFIFMCFFCVFLCSFLCFVCLFNVFLLFFIFFFMSKFQGCAWPRNPNIWVLVRLAAFKKGYKMICFRKKLILDYFGSPLGPHGPHSKGIDTE